MVSAFIQGIGSLAILGILAFLARAAGPATQGSFSALKATFDFLSALCLLGLPQAIVYFFIAQRVSLAQCFTLVSGHGVIVFFAFCLIVLTIRMSPANVPEHLDSVWFGFALALSVTYANARSIVLVNRQTAVFSVVTALPRVLLFGSVMIGAVYLLTYDLPLEEIVSPVPFLFSYAIAGVITLTIAKWDHSIQIVAVGFSQLRQLARYGFATWIPAVAQSGATVFVYRWIELEMGLADGLGAFSAAVALILAILVPLNMVIPILFKWWSPMAQNRRGRELVVVVTWVVCLGIAVWALIRGLEREIIYAMFGRDYLQFLGLFSLLALSLIPQGVFRVFGVYSSSIGRPILGALLEFGRAIFIVSGVMLLGTDLTSTAVMWVVGEFLALAIAVVLVLQYR